jgi:hypothetical protein
LKAQKTQQRWCLYGRTKPGYLLKHHIPAKTARWDVESPGIVDRNHHRPKRSCLLG